MKNLVLALALSTPLLAQAAALPLPGNYDSRVRSLDYNPNDVTEITAYVSSPVDIVFGEGEAVQEHGVFGMKKDEWVMVRKQNHLVVSPLKKSAQSFVKVLTNKRHYNFAFSVAELPKNKNTAAPDNLVFQVSFKYPADEAAKLAAARARDNLKKKMETTAVPRNFNYWVQGSDELAPDEAYDDGTVTTLVFHGNRQIPSIFVVNEDGSESLANRTVEGRKVILHMLARKFVLRKGSSVTCVFNETYDAVGVENTSGTTVPGVHREIIGGTK